jgi:hypothetical protein
VIGFLLEPVRGFFGDEGPTENIRQDFGWEPGHIQRVPVGALEFDYGTLVLSNLLFQGQDRVNESVLRMG